MPHDFFLSYACLDDTPAIRGRPDSAWITTFREALCGRLQFYLRREADVFFDNIELSGNTALTPKIEAALDAAHLFVAISSPTYYSRPWCKFERARFIARLLPNPVLAERVFVIHLTEVDPLIAPQKWQQEFFADVKGYDFFRERDGGRLHTLGSPALDLPIADANSYYGELERLAQDMARRIGALEKGPAPAGAVVAAGGDVVFLAENASRSRPEREELRTALLDAEFDVRSAGGLVGKSVEEVAAATAGALAFVQIVSPVLLELPDGSGTTFDHQQLQAATAAALPRFRWRAVDLDLAAGARSYPGYAEFAGAPDVRQQLLPQFISDLLAALAELRARRRVRVQQQAAPDEARMVLITGAPADLDSHAEAVKRELRRRALGSLISDTPAEDLTAPDVNALLVLYGGGTKEEVRDRLKLIRTLPKDRQRTLRVGIFFPAPPPALDGRPLLYEMPHFQQIVWDQPASFDAFAAAVTA